MKSQQGFSVPLLVPKGYDVFNSYARYLLMDGPRKSSKTINGLNRLMRHAWEVPGSVSGVIAKTLKNAKTGIWRDLVRFVLQGWLDSDIGMKLVDGPKTDAVTKMEYFRVSTSDGGESEIQLSSLEHDQEVEVKFKSTRFSFIYLSEADQFLDRQVFVYLSQQLRLMGIPYDDHHFVMDCNPAEDAEDHWLYDIFFIHKGINESEQKQYKRIPFTLDDNTLLDPRERTDLEASCAYDPVLYDRLIKGKWVKRVKGSHFDGVFFPNIHIVGNTKPDNDDEWEVIVPPKSTMRLIAGVDPGDLNHACGIWCPREADDGETCYDLIDEVVRIGEPIALEEFVDLCYERMVFWNEWLASHYNTLDVRWDWWADASAFVHKASLNGAEFAVFFERTTGRINLKPAPKGRFSVGTRINLIKWLMHRHRLWFSASCKWGCDWARNLRPGRSKTDVIDPRYKGRHAFDADSYAIVAELPADLSRNSRPLAGNRPMVTVV